MSHTPETAHTVDRHLDHQPDEGRFRVIHSEDIQWKPFPAFPPAARLAVLVGDPTKPGPYLIRVKLPAGTKMATSAPTLRKIQPAPKMNLGTRTSSSASRQLQEHSAAAVPALPELSRPRDRSTSDYGPRRRHQPCSVPRPESQRPPVGTSSIDDPVRRC
jgi:hypothetical protein